jgi:hypothetical protein
VRQVAFPVIGEDDLRSLFAEYKLSGSTYRRTVQTTYKASYSNEHRRKVLAVPRPGSFSPAPRRSPKSGAPAPGERAPLKSTYSGIFSLTIR